MGPSRATNIICCDTRWPVDQGPRAINKETGTTKKRLIHTSPHSLVRITTTVFSLFVLVGAVEAYCDKNYCVVDT